MLLYIVIVLFQGGQSILKNFSKTVLESNPKNAKEQLAKTANVNDSGISSE